jgi:DNA phosphorothioation-dependent restriction protein DptG
MDTARDVLLTKYRNNLIKTNIEFRKLGKIARAGKVGGDTAAAQRAIRALVSDPQYSIEQAWTDSVSEEYAERDIVTRIDNLLTKLAEVQPTELDDDVREKLEELVTRARAILEAEE